MLPRGNNSVTVKLDGTLADDGKPRRMVTSTWSALSGPDTVGFGDTAYPGKPRVMQGHREYATHYRPDPRA